jgi:hypothetical protein
VTIRDSAALSVLSFASSAGFARNFPIIQITKISLISGSDNIHAILKSFNPKNPNSDSLLSFPLRPLRALREISQSYKSQKSA